MCSDDAAVLLVGLAGDHLAAHLLSLRRAVLPGLTRPSVFAVGDQRDSRALAGQLPMALGTALRALALVSEHAGVPRPANLPADVAYELIAPAAAASGSQRGVREGARLQWHKFVSAWRLMEASEVANHRAPYGLVLKLRFDATPLDAFRPCASGGMDASSGHVLYAATDKVFWGKRAVMAVAARLFDAIGSTFERPTSDPLGRTIHVRAQLLSTLSVPPAAWSTRKGERQHYNKVRPAPSASRLVSRLPYPISRIPSQYTHHPSAAPFPRSYHRRQVAMLPFPLIPTEDAPPADPRIATTAHLIAALAKGGEVLRPGAVGGAPFGPDGFRFRVVAGLRSAPIDRAVGAFVAERDFLVWLLAHNVSVCDMGAGTVALLYKGERHLRPSLPCATLSASGGATASSSVVPPALLWRAGNASSRKALADHARHAPHRAHGCLPGSACCRRQPSVATCSAARVADARKRHSVRAVQL